MGVRVYRHSGLNPSARQLLYGVQLVWTEETTRTYPDGRMEKIPPKQVFVSTTREDIKSTDFETPYQEGLNFHRYTRSDGRIFVEEIQDQRVGDNDTILFVALKENGEWVPETLWTKEEMDAQQRD